MKRSAGFFLAAALMAAGVVAAQTTSPATPSSDRPTYSTPAPSSSSAPASSAYGTESKEHSQQMKDCMTQQHANNPNLSKSDIKKYCMSHVESSSSSSKPHQ
jgi:hypothetical protein